MALQATGLLDTPAKEATKTPNPGRDFGLVLAELALSPFEAISGVNFFNPTYSSNAGQNIGTAVGGTANAVADVLGAVYGGPAYGAMKAGISGAADAAGAQDSQPINHIAQYGSKIKKHQTDPTVESSYYPFNFSFDQSFTNQQDYETFKKYAEFMMKNYPYIQNLPGYQTSTVSPIDNINTSVSTPPSTNTMGNVGGIPSMPTMPGNVSGGPGFGGANLGETSFDKTSYEASKLIGDSKGGYNTSKTAGQGWQKALGNVGVKNFANIGSAIAGIGGEENKRTLLDSDDYRDMRKEHDNTGASAIASIGRIWSNKTPQQNLFNKTWEDQVNKYKNRSGVKVKQHYASDLGPMQSAQFGGNWGGGTAGFPGSANAYEMPLGMPMQNPTDRIYQNQAMEKSSGGGNDWGTKVGETMGLIGDSVAQVFEGAGGGGGGMGDMGGMMAGMFGGSEGGGGMMDMFKGFGGGSFGGGGTGGSFEHGGKIPSYQTENRVEKNKGTLRGADNKFQEWWNTPQEYTVNGKRYLTSPRNEFSRIGFEGTGTFTSAGGPGVGVRSYFPYSDPLGIGIETDIDPTGPGGGILLSNHRLRQAKNAALRNLGMEEDTSEVRPGMLYGGVEMAGSLPTPFLGLTTSLHDIDKLEEWIKKPENSAYKSIAEGVEKGMGPFLAAWDNPGRLFKDSYLFPKGVHNPLSGSRIGLGGAEGLKGGNIIPDYKYLSLAGGNASVAEEAAELAAEKGWKGKEGLAKARKEILGKFDVGKMIQKTGLPKAMDFLGEKLYGTGSKAGYDRFGKTAAEYIRKFKIPYGNVLSHFTKILGPTLTMMEGVNILEGALHQKGQPTGGMFSGEDEDQSASQYGAFPWRQKEYYDTKAKKDQEALENRSKRYDIEYAKKYGISKEEVRDHEKEKFGRLGWDKELQKALDETGNPINKTDFEKNRNMKGYMGYQYGGRIPKAQMGGGMMSPGLSMLQNLIGGGQGGGGMDMSSIKEYAQNISPEQWKAMQGMFKDGFTAEGLGNAIGGSAGEGIAGIVGGFMNKEYGGDIAEGEPTPKRKGKSPYIATYYYENGGKVMDKTSNLPNMNGFTVLSGADSDIIDINNGTIHENEGTKMMIPVNSPNPMGNFQTEYVPIEAEKGESIIVNRKNPLAPISTDEDIDSVIVASTHLKDRLEDTPKEMFGNTFAKNAKALGKKREKAMNKLKAGSDPIALQTAEREFESAQQGLDALEIRQNKAKEIQEEEDRMDLFELAKNGGRITKKNTYRKGGKVKKLSEYQKDLLGMNDQEQMPMAQSGLNTSDDDWIKDIFNYEARFGSPQGGPVANFGFTDPKYKKAFTEKEAIEAFKKDYLSKVPKDLPIEARKRLADYAFNTGRSVEDLLLFAAGEISLDDINSKKVFTKEWKENKDDILKDLKAGDLIPEIDQAKHDVYKSLGEKRGNTAYEDSWKGRTDMWSNPLPWMKSQVAPNQGLNAYHLQQLAQAPPPSGNTVTRPVPKPNPFTVSGTPIPVDPNIKGGFSLPDGTSIAYTEDDYATGQGVAGNDLTGMPLEMADINGELMPTEKLVDIPCPKCKDGSIPKKDAQGNCLPCPPEKFQPAPAQQLDDSFINDYIREMRSIDDRMEDRMRPYPNYYEDFGKEAETMLERSKTDLPKYIKEGQELAIAQNINRLNQELNDAGLGTSQLLAQKQAAATKANQASADAAAQMFGQEAGLLGQQAQMVMGNRAQEAKGATEAYLETEAAWDALLSAKGITAGNIRDARAAQIANQATFDETAEMRRHMQWMYENNPDFYNKQGNPITLEYGGKIRRDMYEYGSRVKKERQEKSNKAIEDFRSFMKDYNRK